MIARERAFHCISNIRNRHVTSKVFFQIPRIPSQHREYWGGPTNGQAAACRRRLAAVELATSCNPLRPPHGKSQWSQEFDRDSSASLSLCCFLGARVLAKPLQQVSSLGRLVEGKRAVPQRRGQPALRVSTAAQTGLNVVFIGTVQHLPASGL